MKKSELRELIREQVRNLIKEASVSQEAYTIHNITKCGQDAAQNFIDDNKLDGKKLAAYVRQHSNSKEKYDVRDIIAGTGVGANVGFKSRFLKQFKESVIKEADDPEAGLAAPYGSGYSEVNEAIDIHNDESAMKALEDIAVNMTKWKGSEGAHYTDLLEKVIDFLKYGNHRTS